MAFLSLRNKLAYPAGAKPGFDPAHPAAKNCWFSATPAPSANNFINLLNGSKGTITPTPSAVVTDRGPAVSFPNNASDAVYFSTPGLSTNAITIAGIIEPINGGGICFFYNLNANDINSACLYSYNLGVTFSLFGAIAGSMPNLQNKVPYFGVISGIVTGAGAGQTLVNTVVTNLKTGQIFSNANTGTAVNQTVTPATSIIGNGSTSGGTREAQGYVFSAMGASVYLTLPQLIAWAADPWSFWYPNTVADKRTMIGYVGAAAVINQARYVRLKQYARR